MRNMTLKLQPTTFHSFNDKKSNVSNINSTTFFVATKKATYFYWEIWTLRRSIFKDFRSPKPILMGGTYPLLHIWKLPPPPGLKYADLCAIFRGGSRNFPTEGLELPTGGLKWLKMVFPCAILPNFFRREPKISSDGGLDASDGGAVAPLALPWRHPWQYCRQS